MKENSDNEENNISGDQPGINFVKDDTFENISDMLVIEKTRASEQLTVNEINEIIEGCNEKKKSNPQADIIDENFYRLVWSFNVSHHKKKDQNNYLSYADLDQNLLYNLFFYCADEFFRCLYLLDIGFEDLDPVVQKQIKNDNHNKQWSRKHPGEYNIVHKPWLNSIASKMFYNPEKPLDVGFFVWLNKNGYFAKHNEIVFYESYGGSHQASSSKLLPFDEFESICKERKKNRIGNYKFKMFDEFKNFVGLDRDDDQYKKEYYSQAGISVKSLLDVLKKENRFLTKDEFIKLVNRENIFFDKPENLTKDDIEGWDDYKSFINKSGKIGDKEKEKRREARKKCWEWMKFVVFGDPQKNTQSLLDMKDLSETDLKSISDCLSNKFEFFTGMQLFCDSADIFDNSDGKYKKYIADDLKKFEDLFLPANNLLILKQINNINNHINENGERKDNHETFSNVTRRIIGIILSLIGIIGCGVILGLGLTSKGAVVLLFLFVSMAIAGALYLICEKISRCLAPCCSSLFSPSTQENSPNINEKVTQDQNLNLASIRKNEIEN